MEKVDKILKTFYNQYKEENRLKKSNHNRLEFITTTKYIEKYLKKNDKILEVGAGTGAYSLYYAKQGYDVTAIELVEENIEKLKQGITEKMNDTTFQCRYMFFCAFYIMMCYNLSFLLCVCYIYSYCFI